MFPTLVLVQWLPGLQRMQDGGISRDVGDNGTQHVSNLATFNIQHIMIGQEKSRNWGTRHGHGNIVWSPITTARRMRSRLPAR